jgi:hypothetical protein
MEETGQVVQLTQEEHAAHMAQMEAQLKVFWAGQLAEMEKLEVGSEQGKFSTVYVTTSLVLKTSKITMTCRWLESNES